MVDETAAAAFLAAPGALPIALEPVESLSITTLIDNSVDMLAVDQGPARRPGRVGGERRAVASLESMAPDGLIAEHGFSALVSVHVRGRERRLLFDAGVSPDGMVENMRRLEIAPADLEALVFSHGHYDHTTGLDGLIRRLGRANLPVLLHPDFWNVRRVLIPGHEPMEIPTTSRGALEGAGFEITDERRPSFVFEHSLLVTGEVDRTTDYEPGFPPQEAYRDGKWQPDPLVLDDQALVANVAGKGLVVVTGCGHAGVINIVRHAQRLTGVRKVYAVLGGFHLSGRIFEPLIPRVCDDLAALAPEIIVPAHCTGFRAQHALASRFGDAFIPNTVGTRLDLGGA